MERRLHEVAVERDQAEALYLKALDATNDTEWHVRICDCMLQVQCFTTTNEAIDKLIVKNPKSAGLYECRAASCLSWSDAVADKDPELASQLKQQARTFSNKAAALRAL
jgi:hypothetical protein